MTVNINVPDELYRKAQEIAASEKATVDDVFASAFAEQLAAWERLRARAEHGSRERFQQALALVPDVEPEPDDRV
jgi:hypothetical protein